MPLKGRQGRFLGLTIGGWIAARVWLLWPVASVAVGGAAMTGTAPDRTAALRLAPVPPVPPATPVRRVAGRPVPSLGMARGDAVHEAEASRGQQASLPLPASSVAGAATVDRGSPHQAMPADRLPFSPAMPPMARRTGSGRAIEGQAYLFVRPGSGRAALAPGGSLGGSQAAARVAVALNRSGPVRTAVAARLYAPLQTKGAEAAVGLDWHPLGGVPLRVSVERRIGLDDAGRNAWSAYAAGGFYAGRLPLRLEADGYAQAGVVGIRSHALFADGAVRVGRRIAVGPAQAVIGAGTWGAAQPGAARLDVGPRLALSLPVDRHRLTLAAEGRLRVAGHAAPGSGAALTLAADF